MKTVDCLGLARGRRAAQAGRADRPRAAAAGRHPAWEQQQGDRVHRADSVLPRWAGVRRHRWDLGPRLCGDKAGVRHPTALGLELLPAGQRSLPRLVAVGRAAGGELGPRAASGGLGRLEQPFWLPGASPRRSPGKPPASAAQACWSPIRGQSGK